MRTLQFKVIGQSLSKDGDFSGLIAGTKGYLYTAYNFDEQDTWKADLVFEEESFDLLQDILEDAGELAERAPYKDLVTTEFAEKAIQ